MTAERWWALAAASIALLERVLAIRAQSAVDVSAHSSYVAMMELALRCVD